MGVAAAAQSNKFDADPEMRDPSGSEMRIKITLPDAAEAGPGDAGAADTISQ